MLIEVFLALLRYPRGYPIFSLAQEWLHPVKIRQHIKEV